MQKPESIKQRDIACNVLFHSNRYLSTRLTSGGPCCLQSEHIIPYRWRMYIKFKIIAVCKIYINDMFDTLIHPVSLQRWFHWVKKNILSKPLFHRVSIESWFHPVSSLIPWFHPVSVIHNWFHWTSIWYLVWSTIHNTLVSSSIYHTLVSSCIYGTLVSSSIYNALVSFEIYGTLFDPLSTIRRSHPVSIIHCFIQYLKHRFHSVSMVPSFDPVYMVPWFYY